jgi:hypothetical protein
MYTPRRRDLFSVDLDQLNSEFAQLKAQERKKKDMVKIEVNTRQASLYKLTASSDHTRSFQVNPTF